MRAEISIVIKDDSGNELNRYDKAVEDRDLEVLVNTSFQIVYYDAQQTLERMKLEIMEAMSNPEKLLPSKTTTKKAKRSGKST
jgi:hypothetical protein